MDATNFVLLALHAVGGEIQGKTKLQKTIYFLGVMTGHLDDLGYRAHYYGPYSDDVADAVKRLRSVDFVDQSAAGCGTVGKFGFEVCRYDFSLTQDGKQIADAKAAAFPDLTKRLERAAKTLREAGNPDYVRLSIAAKTHFMLGKKKGEATMAELARLARRFGWKVASHQVKEAAQYLSTLDLVRLS
ncbi:MAG: hypothetical protein WBD05_09820 [Phycisphaerae bacterium]